MTDSRIPDSTFSLDSSPPSQPPLSSNSSDGSATPRRGRLATFGAAIRDAVRGAEHDYTSGSIARAIALLAIPMMLEMGMESLFAVTDIFFVAKLGSDAVATVGLTESFLTITYAIAIGLSIGVTATVARRIGESDPDGAAIAAVQGILFGLVVAVVLGTLGVIFAEDLLRLMGASPSVIRTGSTFTRVMLGGEFTVILLFLINAIFRGAGDAAIAMRVLVLANSFNIVLGPLFIFGVGPFPELGVTGAAVATTIGRGIGLAFASYRLVRGGGRIHIQRKHLQAQWQVMRPLLRISGAGVVQLLVGTASWVGLVRILASHGSAAVAGYTIGIRMVIFAILPSAGIANAAATMVGQALGARNPNRAEKSVWMAGKYNLFYLLATGALFLIAPEWIVSLFTHDPEVAGYAVNCLRIIALGFPTYAYGMVITQALNGAGDTWTPTWLNLVAFWMFEIPLAYFLSEHTSMGPRGTFVAIALAFALFTVLSAVVFMRGTWKTKTV